jgi:hypothetical protein
MRETNMPEFKFCSRGGCTGIAENGKFCAACQESGAGKRLQTSVYDRWYDTSAWRRTIRPYKLRHDPMCEGCLIKPATDVHHKDGSWKVTGDWRLFISQENLASLCHECHSAITMKENQNVHHA